MGKKEFKSKSNTGLSFHRKWLVVINMYFFHCKMISNGLTQEDPKNPARALTDESYCNSPQFTLFLYCTNQGQSLWSLACNCMELDSASLMVPSYSKHAACHWPDSPRVQIHVASQTFCWQWLYSSHVAAGTREQRTCSWMLWLRGTKAGPSYVIYIWEGF